MNASLKLLCSLVTLIFMVNPAHAYDVKADQDAYYAISSMQVTKIAEDDLLRNDVVLEKDFGNKEFSAGSVGEVIAVADQIIAFGERVYAIVKKGKPVVNTSYAPISVLPRAKKGEETIEAMDLEGWRYPKSVKYRITYKNGFGMNVVVFTYSVNFSYGGSYNGKGKYITNAQIVPEDLTVQWGFEFNASSKLVGIVNNGTKSAPVAGATVIISYSVDSVISSSKSNVSYHFVGDGQIREI